MNQQGNTNANQKANANQKTQKQKTQKQKTQKQKTQKQPPKYKPFPCPCGGGKSCIVERRMVGDWVHEDDVFQRFRLPIRKNCYTAHSQDQLNAMKPYFSM